MTLEGTHNAPIELVQSRKRTVLHFLGSITFVLIGGVVMLYGSSPLWGVAAIVFFGLCAIIFGLGLVRSNGLTISPHGLGIVRFGTLTLVPWTECANFRVWNTGRTTAIAYDVREAHLSFSTRLNRSLGFPDACVPAYFDVPVDELVDLLNSAQTQWSASPSGS